MMPSLGRMTLGALGIGLVVVLIAAGEREVGARSQQPVDGPMCDVSGVRAGSGITARAARGVTSLEWAGAGTERLRLGMSLDGGAPVIRELAIRRANGTWVTIAGNARLEFTIVEGFRRISNQQLVPLRELKVPLTSDVVNKYKWDVFWDAPLDLSAPGRGGNPPPAEGVGGQPGLPRKPEEIRRATVRYDATRCAVTTSGARAQVRVPGLTLGSFTGDFLLTVYEGTNLIRVEAVAATQLPSVAYKYDIGLTGLTAGPQSRVSWHDVSRQLQSYALRGPVNADHVTLRAANRIVVAETSGGTIAAFPPPHTFFWSREVEVNVGYNWYRKDDDRSFSIGIRQGEEEVVPQYRANWSLYSAPPGSEQHMAGFFYPTLGDRAATFQAALAFTNGDVFKPLPGYKVMASHYHTDLGRDLIATGSLDSRLSDFEVLRSAGINIAGPVDRPQAATRLQEMKYLFEGARRHSDQDFMVMPQLENDELLGGHWDLLFSHPVYYVETRPPGSPLVTQHPEFGRMYNIGSADDILAMAEAENMLISLPHPRTKGSTGYPDAVKTTKAFLHDRYRSAGWRWGMGSDLSEKRLSDYRVLPLLDEMNNWIADTPLRLKYLMAITETYDKRPGDDIYANGPVSYLRMNALPEPGDYRPIIDVLTSGDYFVSSGEVLIPRHQYQGAGANMTVTADVQWTFPLEFVEVVTGDGAKSTTKIVSAADLRAFGTKTFTIPFNGQGQKWVRFAAWDSAGNGALTMPIRLPAR